MLLALLSFRTLLHLPGIELLLVLVWFFVKASKYEMATARNENGAIIWFFVS